MNEEHRLVLSEAFTVEDIRRLREYNHLRRIKMTAREVNEDTRKGAELFLHLVKDAPDTKGITKA